MEGKLGAGCPAGWPAGTAAELTRMQPPGLTAPWGRLTPGELARNPGES
jgi:hypothetical protein